MIVTYLAEIEQILKNRNLPELETMIDRVTHEECGDKMLNWSSLATVRPEIELVEVARLSHVVEDGHVGEHVVQVIRVGWVVLASPLEVSVSIKNHKFYPFTLSGVTASKSKTEFSGLDSSSTESNPMTYWRNLCRAG